MSESLRVRDGKLINAWYVACLSHELKSKPISRTIYDRPLVLFRTASGSPACLPDRCLHRAAPLSAGEIRGERLACPYHGWEYGANGDVERIPAEVPSATPTRKLCQTALPLREIDGAIWVWMGQPSLADEALLWRFPCASDRTWQHYFMITDFPNEVTNLVENFMDVPHTVYVHRGWFRDESPQRKAVPATVETKDGRVTVTYHQKDDEFSWAAKLLLNAKGKAMKHSDAFIFPNLTRVDYQFGESAFIINSQCTPISTMSTRVYTYIAYKIAHFQKALKPIFQFYTRRVIEQDVEVMSLQAQVLARRDSAGEKLMFHSSSCDAMHVAIERLRHYGVHGDPRVFSAQTTSEITFWL
jgi:phenylpropionate dioxygenase-like ring-hydroxylating dioxygenase large terminal subunit